MLIRIRRLAGSFVGAAFILLLSISMLQTGNSLNPLAFFQGSPVVIEVGKEKQRWNTLDISNAIVSVFDITAPAYAAQGYGPLTTAMAIKDSWKGGRLTLPSELQGLLQNSLLQQDGSVTPDALAAAFNQIEPMVNIFTAFNWQVESQSDLLPASLADVPVAQVTRTYDFDLIELANDTSNIASPDDATLQTYISDNPDQFQRPQTWAIEALILDDITLAERIEVTEDQVRLFYDQNLDLFTQNESWDYQTLTFATALEANLFTSQLDQGVDFDTAVSASTAQVSNQGFRENSAFSAETLAQLDAANIGILTGPDEGPDGSLVYSYLKAYVPEKMETLEEAYSHAEELLKLELAGEQLSEMVLELQREANSENMDLQTVAQANGYDIEVFEGLQFSQTAPPALNSPGLFERLGFIQETREATSRFELEPGTREILFTVTSYEPQREQTFEEAKIAALLFWKDDQAREQSSIRAENLADILRSGVSVEDAVASLNDPLVEVQTSENLSRLNLSTLSNPSIDLFANLDRVARARLVGATSGPLETQLLNANPRIISPFTLKDKEVLVVDVLFGQAIIVAHHRDTEQDTDVRENLVKALADSATSNLFAQALLGTYLDDVASTRPATVNQNAIDSENLARQQAQAQQGSGY